MEGNALCNLVESRGGRFSEDFVRWTLYQVALGIQCMHAHNVLHRDLKSDNILCNAKGDIKICDMGLSVLLSEM